MTATATPIPAVGTVARRESGRTVTVIGNTAGIAVEWDQQAGCDWFCFRDFAAMFEWDGKVPEVD